MLVLYIKKFENQKEQNLTLTRLCFNDTDRQWAVTTSQTRNSCF